MSERVTIIIVLFLLVCFCLFLYQYNNSLKDTPQKEKVQSISLEDTSEFYSYDDVFSLNNVAAEESPSSYSTITYCISKDILQKQFNTDEIFNVQETSYNSSGQSCVKYWVEPDASTVENRCKINR